jgi:isoleucyl-tRNA synthetase
MEALVLLGRNYREKIQVKAKIPLRSMKVIHRNSKVLSNLQKFEPYFKDELNVQRVEYFSNEDDFIQVSAKANFPALGPKLGPKMKTVAAEIQKLTPAEILKLEAGETLELEGFGIVLSDLEIRRAPKTSHPQVSTHQLVSIEIDPTVTPEQVQEGLAREVIRKIQAARKNADFNLDDRIDLQLYCPAALEQAAKIHQSKIQSETLAVQLTWTSDPQGQHKEEAEIDGEMIRIGITPIRHH